MSEMVGRVAKAMAKEHFKTLSSKRIDYEKFARAAIAAMREPTQEMVTAGLGAIPSIKRWQAMIDEALK